MRIYILIFILVLAVIVPSKCPEVNLRDGSLDLIQTYVDGLLMAKISMRDESQTYLKRLSSIFRSIMSQVDSDYVDAEMIREDLLRTFQHHETLSWLKDNDNNLTLIVKNIAKPVLNFIEIYNHLKLNFNHLKRYIEEFEKLDSHPPFWSTRHQNLITQWIDFAHSITNGGSIPDISSPNNSVINRFRDLHYLIVNRYVSDKRKPDPFFENGSNERYGTLLESVIGLNNMLVDEAKTGFICLSQIPSFQSKSIGEITHELYELVDVAYSSVQSVLLFSYLVKYLTCSNPYRKEETSCHDTMWLRLAEHRLKDFKLKNQQKLHAFKSISKELDHSYWNCINNISDYETMNGYIQGIVMNEQDLNDRGSCRAECKTFAHTKLSKKPSNSCLHFWKNEHNYDGYRLCDQSCQGGVITECQFFDADASICRTNVDKFELTNPNIDTTPYSRRYEWIAYEDGTILGRKNHLSDPLCLNNEIIKLDSWWRVPLFVHCSHCLCKCVKDDLAPIWSLRPSVSNIMHNKIVVGVKLHRHDKGGSTNMFGLVVVEAIAKGRGKFDLNRMNVVEVNTPKTDRTSDENEFTMTYENGKINLNKLVAPSGHVVTGVRLQLTSDKRLELNIRVTKIDYESGQLDVFKTRWIQPGRSINNLNIDMKDRTIPTAASSKPIFDLKSKGNGYLVVDTTSAKADVMQSTIPYIDTETVSTSSWLSGVELYHKEVLHPYKKYGGYLGLGLETFHHEYNT